MASEKRENPPQWMLVYWWFGALAASALGVVELLRGEWGHALALLAVSSMVANLKWRGEIIHRLRGEIDEMRRRGWRGFSDGVSVCSDEGDHD